MEPKLIGVCLSLINAEDRVYILQELNKAACRDNFRLLVFNTCTDTSVEIKAEYEGDKLVYSLIPYDKLSAMIIFPRHIPDPGTVSQIVAQCLSHHLPVISMEEHIPGTIYFSLEYADSFEQMVDHVIEEHHAKTLYMIGGVCGNIFSEERNSVFRHSLLKHGLPYSDTLVDYGNFWEGGAKEVLTKWFEEEHRPLPDAIICANDMMGIATMVYLQDKGIRVPEDCIVTGYDNVNQAHICFPLLTTCGPDYEKLGEAVIATIKEALSGQSPADRSISYKPIFTQSCGCKPKEIDQIHRKLYDMFWILNRTQERERFMYRLQLTVSNMDSLQEIANTIMDEYTIGDGVFAVYPEIFTAPMFGEGTDQPREPMVDIVGRRYGWEKSAPVPLSAARLLPDWDILLSRELPIVICFSHYLDIPMGYCAFQTEISINEYEKLLVFMSTVNASLGIYRSKLRLSSKNATLEYLYVHDHMTGLYNRRGFYQEFDELCRKNSKKPCFVAVLSVDIDGLKYINDNFGHAEGDKAITAVAHALAQSSCQDGICARFGGDEFVCACLIPESDSNAYYADFRKRFDELLSNMNSKAKLPYPIGASVGYVSQRLTTNFHIDTLFRLADNKMYADKTIRKQRRNNQPAT